jgi:flagellar biosynthesis protein FlhB
MSSEDDFGEKTEEPTPEKRQRARDEGQMARSRDGGAVAATGAVVVLLMSAGTMMAGVLRIFAIRCFQNPHGLGPAEPGQILKDFGTSAATLTLPIALAAALGGLAAGLLEAGFNPRLELAEPNWQTQATIFSDSRQYQRSTRFVARVCCRCCGILCHKGRISRFGQDSAH